MSQFEWEQYEARRKERASKFAHPTQSHASHEQPDDLETPDGAEREIQLAIYRYCVSRRWICCMGRMDHKTHRTPVGENDLYIFHPSGRIIPIEVKRPKGGRLSKAQETFIRHAASLGITVYVVKSLSDVIAICDGLTADAKPSQGSSLSINEQPNG